MFNFNDPSYSLHLYFSSNFIFLIFVKSAIEAAYKDCGRNNVIDKNNKLNTIIINDFIIL